MLDLGGDAQIFSNRHFRIDLGDLKTAADAVTRTVAGIHAGNVAALAQDLALMLQLASGQHVEQSRLAGAVGADQAIHTAGFKVMIDVVNRFQRTETDADIWRIAARRCCGC